MSRKQDIRSVVLSKRNQNISESVERNFVSLFHWQNDRHSVLSVINLLISPLSCSLARSPLARWRHCCLQRWAIISFNIVHNDVQELLQVLLRRHCELPPDSAEFISDNVITAWPALMILLSRDTSFVSPTGCDHYMSIRISSISYKSWIEHIVQWAGVHINKMQNTLKNQENHLTLKLGRRRMDLLKKDCIISYSSWSDGD